MAETSSIISDSPRWSPFVFLLFAVLECQRVLQALPRPRKPGVAPDDGREFGDRVIQASVHGKRTPKVKVCLQIARIELNCLPEFANGIGELFQAR